VFVGSYFLSAIGNLVNLLLTVYMWIIIARAVLSWVSPDPSNPIVRFLYRVTEPVLRPVRRALPTYQMGLDLSPMIVLLAIYFLQQFLVPVIYRIASEIG
jgi:YggT family protein